MSVVASKVLIVGASFSGLHLLHYLKDNHKLYNVNKLEITLVEPKDYFEYTPGILHALTGSNSYSKISDLIVNMVGHGDVIYDKNSLEEEKDIKKMDDSPECIQSVDCQIDILRGLLVGFQPSKKKAFISINDPNNNDSNQNPKLNDEYISCIDYDVMVICSGLSYTNPIRPSQQSLHVSSALSSSISNTKYGHNYISRKDEIKQFYNSLLLSETILIAGGGLVGVELAAEIAVRMKVYTNLKTQKKSKRNVILITRSKALVDTLPKQAGVYVYDWMIQNDVKVYLDNELTSITHTNENNPNAVTAVTARGETIKADFYIDCTGRYTPNTVENEFTSNRMMLLNSYLKDNDLPTLVPLSTTMTATGDSDNDNVYPFPFMSSRRNILVNEYFLSVQFPKDKHIYAIGDIANQNRPLALSASLQRDDNVFAVPHQPCFVKNANFAGYEAKVCANNVLHSLNSLVQTVTQSSSLSSNSNSKTNSISHIHLMKYPEDVFGGNSDEDTVTVSEGSSGITGAVSSSSTSTETDVLIPLSVCISLGPYNAVLVMNNLVLGGWFMGRIATVIKHVIEMTKVAELKGLAWGRIFWFCMQKVIYVKTWLEYRLRKWRKRKAASVHNTGTRLAY